MRIARQILLCALLALISGFESPANAAIDFTSNLAQYGASSGDIGSPVSVPEVTDFSPISNTETAGPIGGTFWSGTGTGTLGENLTTYQWVNGTGFWGYPVQSMGMFYVPDLIITGGPDTDIDIQVRVEFGGSANGTFIPPSQEVNWRVQLHTLSGFPIDSAINGSSYVPNGPTQSATSLVLNNVPVGQLFSLALSTQWPHAISNSALGITTNADGFMRLDSTEVFVLPDGYTLNSSILGIIDNTIPAPIIGDLNADGFVGIADLNIVLGNWNQNVTPGVWLLGDPTGDGFVGIADLNTVLGNWNAGTPPTLPGAAIPEPASFACLAACGLLIMLRR